MTNVSIKNIKVGEISRDILVKKEGNDEIVYMPVGNAAQIINLANASDFEKLHVYGVDNIRWQEGDTLHVSLATAAGLVNLYTIVDTNKEADGCGVSEVKEDAEVYPSTYEEDVKKFIALNGFEVVCVLKYAKTHGNVFPAFAGLLEDANADDVYCAAIADVMGEDNNVVNTFFSLIDGLNENTESTVTEKITKLWDAAKVIREIVK